MFHMYAGALTSWFWAANVLSLVIVLSTRLSPPRASAGLWALVGIVLIIIACGDVVLSEQAISIVASRVPATDVTKLKIPVVVSSLVWGSIGVTQVSNWLTSPAYPNCSSKRTGEKAPPAA